MIGDEPLQARFQETHLRPSAHHKTASDQPLPPPSRDRPGGDIVTPAHLRHCEHRLDGLLNKLPHGGRKILHEQLQVMPNAAAFEHQPRPAIWSVSSDTKTKVLVRIMFRSIDLDYELLGTLNLLEPAILRCIPGLLVLKLFHRRMTISFRHPRAPRAVGSRPAGTALLHAPDAPTRSRSAIRPCKLF